MLLNEIFSKSALNDLSDQNCRIALMNPRDFLRLAPPIASRIKSKKRRRAIAKALDKSLYLHSIPYLILDIMGPDAFVVSHDGRHRALELASRGINEMPVVIEFENGTPSDFDHISRIYPEPHDEDEEYPGYDEESLDDKLKPVPREFIGQLIIPSKYRAMISESPIADFQFIGDPDTPYTFDTNDLKAVRNQKWHAKLLKTFEKTPMPINIYLMNPRDNRFDNTATSFSREKDPYYILPRLTDLDAVAGQYIARDFQENFGFKPRDYQSSISFVFTNNYGDGKIALTPWIIAHRGIHAMMNTAFGIGRSTFDSQRYYLDFRRAVARVISDLVFNMWRQKNGLDPQTTGDVMRQVSNLKSAKAGYEREGEFFVELATQYFLFGNFKFDLSAYRNDPQYADYEQILNKARDSLGKMFSEAVGKIFVL